MQYIAQKGLILPIYTTQTRPAALSQAEDTQPETLDFIEYLIKKSPSAFFVKMTDDSMTGAGIMPNDILLLERNSEPTHEDIVLAVVDGEFTVKRLVRKPNRIELKPENSKYQPTKINDESELKVWGVVKHAIHQL
ncbi:MAG: S24 family peptidase [Planctomycetaceae bacterium]|nr:S24 family peptidase [Planctomycetaceae bacterium]